jgi:IS1 family transposase/transposase-like protein
MRTWLLALVLLVIILLVVGRARQYLQRRGPVLLPRILQRWRPRTPDACAHCRLADTGSAAPTPPPVRPWREGRSRRGAPRRIPTQGYACRRPGCPYYGVTDALVHALVADGHHGRSDRIQDFVCQACGSKVTARWGTALYQLKTPPTRIGEVLSALAEGLDIGAAVRVFGHGETTITRWRDRAARQAERVHHHFLRGLHLPHLQLDEIRARLRRCDRVTWFWLALDPRTKLIPALALGPRTQQTAHTLVHALRAVLAASCTPVVTTDGLRHYYYALTAHFGRWVKVGRRRHWQVDPALLHGQVQKRYRRRRLVRIRYQMCSGSRRALRIALRCLGWSGKLQTAFIERLNLTARQSVAALARRTWATAHTAAGLQRQVHWWRAYYHFSRPHRSLRQDGRARTPAMAAGLTTHRWTVREFLGYPCAQAG